jgi:hypothetical protein
VEVLGLSASVAHALNSPDHQDTHPDIEKRLLNYFYSGLPQSLPPYIGHLLQTNLHFTVLKYLQTHSTAYRMRFCWQWFFIYFFYFVAHVSIKNIY